MNNNQKEFMGIICIVTIIWYLFGLVFLGLNDILFVIVIGLVFYILMYGVMKYIDAKHSYTKAVYFKV